MAQSISCARRPATSSSVVPSRTITDTRGELLQTRFADYGREACVLGLVRVHRAQRDLRATIDQAAEDET